MFEDLCCRISMKCCLLSLIIVVLLNIHDVSAVYSTTFVNSTAPSGNYRGCVMSSSGETIIAAQNSGYIYKSSNYGYNWIKTNANYNYWYSIAADASFELICAVSFSSGIYLSTNSGVDWSHVYPINDGVRSVFMSTSGQYIYVAAAHRGIYYSHNYGQNWQTSLLHNTTQIYTNEDWNGVTCSDDGKYVYVTDDQGFLFKSSDYGQSINQINGTIRLGWTGIATSNNGSVVVAGQSDAQVPGYIYISRSYGNDSSFVRSGSGEAFWYGVACALNCSTILASAQPGFLYMSTDSGMTFTEMNAPESNWWSIAVSSSTQYIAAASNSGSGGVYLNLYAPSSQPSAQPSSVPTTSWPSSTPSSTPSTQPTTQPTVLDYFVTSLEVPAGSPEEEWTSISMSKSGQYLVAVASEFIYTSSDYGYVWSQSSIADLRDWRAVVSSDSGQIVYAAGYIQSVYNSSDYGVTWSEESASEAREWTALACNSSGQMVVAVSQHTDNGPKPVGAVISVSYDWGASWTNAAIEGNFNNKTWTSVTSSSSGQFVSATMYLGGIYTSSDYGSSFVLSFNVSLPWNSITSSSNGKYQTAVVDNVQNLQTTGAGVYLSQDFGSTWSVLNKSPFNAPNEFYSVASSSSGEYLVITNYLGCVYFSSNYGADWITSSCGVSQWENAVISGDGQYVAVLSSFQIYLTLYSPTSQPSSSPSAVPSRGPVGRPTSSPTAAPSLQPHTSHPSSFPSSLPSSQPSVVPSLYPTYSTDWLVPNVVVDSTSATSLYTFNNIGSCDTSAYVSATIVVSYLDQHSGGYINITAGVPGGPQVLVSSKCAPSTTCGTIVCAVNVDVSAALSCEGGGSVTLNATTGNANQYSGLQSVCTNGGNKNLLYAISYTVSAQPRPTASPTHAPTNNNGDFVFEASPNTPFYVIALFSLLCVAVGVMVVRVKDRSNREYMKFSEMTLRSACLDFAMIGYHIVSELFYIIVLFSEGGEVLNILGALVVCIRLSGMVIAFYFLLLSLGPSGYSARYGAMVDKKHFFSNAPTYTAVILLMLFDQSIVRYLPWRANAFTSISRGFPDQHLFRMCTLSKLAQLTLTLIIQIVVLSYSDAYLFTKGSDSIALALVLLYLVSSVLSFVVFAVTNMIRLRMTSDNSSTGEDKDGSTKAGNPIHNKGHVRETELSIIDRPIGVNGGATNEDKIALSAVLARVQALEENNALLRERVSELERAKSSD